MMRDMRRLLASRLHHQECTHFPNPTSQEPSHTFFDTVEENTIRHTMSTNPRNIAVLIFLFLGSALVTLTVKSSNWHSLVPGRPGRHGAYNSHRVQASPKFAYATFLAANTNSDRKETDAESEAIDDEDDGYYLSARLLAYQLMYSRSAGTNTSIPFIVICTEDVSKRKRARLAKDGAIVKVFDRLEADWVHPGVARWADVLAKLRLFTMTEWSKILFIDADNLVTAPLDRVFYDEATLTQSTLADPEAIKDDEAPLPGTYMLATHAYFFGFDHPFPPETDGDYLNCGFFVFTPSQALFNYYLSLLKLPSRFDPGFPEQNLLNYAHRRDGNMPWKPLWYGWNVNFPTEKDWRGGARSFHEKYRDDDPSHDPFLQAMWREQRAEMEGFYRGRDGGV
jgi:alpha-N-acetylglucosamine transferase